MPTTLQAYPHPLLAFAKNAIKRAAYGNLWRFVVHGGSTEWPELAQSLLGHALRRGGVFHLWGHSWEIETANMWGQLNTFLKLISTFNCQFETNGDVQGPLH